MRMDLTAPGFDPEAVGLPWWRRAWRQGIGYYLPPIGFLVVPLFFAWGSPAPGMVGLALRLLLVGVLYLGCVFVLAWPYAARLVWIVALMAAIASLAVPILGVASSLVQACYYVPYVTCSVGMVLPWRQARVLIVAASVATVVLGAAGHDVMGVTMGIMAGVLGYSIASGIQSERHERALNREQERTAALAVAAERERIGRDLHDILGHSLTAIAVKAELAERLLDRDLDAARAQLTELTAVAREALADVRATASGIRQVRVATEIASARSVLAAADIECVAPSSLPVYPDGIAELLGYVVREGVTNVVRHAGATRCTITADEAGVCVTDDGHGIRAGRGGVGLAGLRARAEAAGAALRVDSSAAGTALTCTLAKEAA